MRVLKFGGTSVGSPSRIQSVVNLVNDGQSKIVVLSAMSGTTNKLVEISSILYQGKKAVAQEMIQQFESDYRVVVNELLSNPASIEKGLAIVEDIFKQLYSYIHVDFHLQHEKLILSVGELLSTNLMQIYCEQEGIRSHLIPALDYMRIDKDGEPDYFYVSQNINRIIAEHTDIELFITQGFICRDFNGNVDNLKRGGSDYSAALVGAAIKADEIQIWTDIDGFHNNDPRFVEDTIAIRQLSFDEAAELAYFGAKILHPTSVQPAKRENIPVRLKNTLNPEDEGTLITQNSNNHKIKAVAAKDGITSINIRSTNMLLAYGFLTRVFEIFEKWKTPIDMITTSEVAVSLTIDDDRHINEIVEALSQLGTIDVQHNLSIICIVGDFSTQANGLAAQVLDSLTEIPLKMISYGGSEHNISVVLDSCHKQRALNDLSSKLLNTIYNGNC